MMFILTFSFFFFFVCVCRVLKAPGGGSSDIFGGSVPSTPRSVKNNQVSNIFGNGDCKNGNANGNGNGKKKLQATLNLHEDFLLDFEFDYFYAF